MTALLPRNLLLEAGNQTLNRPMANRKILNRLSGAVHQSGIG